MEGCAAVFSQKQIDLACDGAASNDECISALTRCGCACADIFRPRGAGCEVCESMVEQARELRVELVEGELLGHGVGISHREPPNLCGADSTVLAPGMVMVVAPAIRGPRGERMVGKDTFLVTQDGNRVVGWYKDWREPFVANHLGVDLELTSRVALN